jgi:hypothetical protein
VAGSASPRSVHPVPDGVEEGAAAAEGDGDAEGVGDSEAAGLGEDEIKAVVDALWADDGAGPRDVSIDAHFPSTSR